MHLLALFFQVLNNVMIRANLKLLILWLRMKTTLDFYLRKKHPYANLGP